MPEVCRSCVLLVDDDPSIRELLSIHLQKAGLRAIHAEDGIDALVRLREALPSVIVTDMLMPRMTGLGVYRSGASALPDHSRSRHLRKHSN